MAQDLGGKGSKNNKNYGLLTACTMNMTESFGQTGNVNQHIPGFFNGGIMMELLHHLIFYSIIKIDSSIIEFKDISYELIGWNFMFLVGSLTSDRL